MNQLDRNIADAIENPFDGCEDTYDGIIGYLDQVCISKRSSTRMPNYDFMYTMCRYDLANGDLFVSMPVPENERYWVVHVHNNNTTVEFKINNLQIENERYEFLVTSSNNQNGTLSHFGNDFTLIYRIYGPNLNYYENPISIPVASIINEGCK